MLPGPLPARPSDRILARTEARGCSKGQREQRFRFALIKFLFLPFCDLLFPTSIIHSCKVNDATGPAWDGDGGGSMKTPGWAVTFCRPQNFPRAFGSMQPSAVLHPRGNRVGSICPGFFFLYSHGRQSPPGARHLLLTGTQDFMAFHAWQCRGCLKERSGVGGRDWLFLQRRSFEGKKGEGITYLGDCRGKMRGIALIF